MTTTMNKLEKKWYCGKNLTAYNTGLAKVAVQCYADTFLVNYTLALRINPDYDRDGENRYLSQAVNCYESCCGRQYKPKPTARNDCHVSSQPMTNIIAKI
jgi:hypothetical protein